MPVIARALTAPEIGKIEAPGTHAVGGVTGLCLQITATGARSWLLRIKVGERRREFGLGAYPTVTVVSARDKARRLRERIGGGADPAVQRRAASAARRVVTSKTVTFKACAEAFLGAELAAGREARYVATALRDLERLAFPQFGTSSVESVTTESVLSVVSPIWPTKTSVAKKLRGNIERVLEYATTQGFRDGPNPARWTGNLDALLASPKAMRPVDHHASLPVKDIPGFFAELHRMSGIATYALQFLILTASRPKDVREMNWSEVDLDTATWRIVADRSQVDSSRQVPMPKQAVCVLRSLPQLGLQAPVFAAPRTGLALSDMTLTAVVRRMNHRRRVSGMQLWIDPGLGSREIVPSGFRESFLFWAAQRPEHRDSAASLLSTPSPQRQASTKTPDVRPETTRRTLEEWARFCQSEVPA